MDKKVNVRLVAVGSVFYELDLNRIQKWKSNFFQIEVVEERHYLPRKSDGREDDTWEYSYEQLEKSLYKFRPSIGNELDLTIFVLDAPIEEDYLTYIIGPNRIVLTYYDARDFMLKENIPLENYLISNIYTYVFLLFSKLNSGQKPVLIKDDEDDITHDYREGCIYDFCGTKEDIVFSCVKPIICNRCTKYLTEHGVAMEDINQAKKELKRLKRNRYYQVVQWLKFHPMDSFFLSCFLAVILSIIAGGVCESCSCFCRVVAAIFFIIIALYLAKFLYSHFIRKT